MPMDGHERVPVNPGFVKTMQRGATAYLHCSPRAHVHPNNMESFLPSPLSPHSSAAAVPSLRDEAAGWGPGEPASYRAVGPDGRAQPESPQPGFQEPPHPAPPDCSAPRPLGPALSPWCPRSLAPGRARWTGITSMGMLILLPPPPAHSKELCWGALTYPVEVIGHCLQWDLAVLTVKNDDDNRCLMSTLI